VVSGVRLPVPVVPLLVRLMVLLLVVVVVVVVALELRSRGFGFRAGREATRVNKLPLPSRVERGGRRESRGNVKGERERKGIDTRDSDQ